MSVRIMTDSGSDIKQKTADKWGITVLPLSVRFGDEEYFDDVTLTADELYMRMSNTGELPKTSQVPPCSYEEAFRKAVDAGDTVICICLSSGLSGCYQSACIAAKEFGGKVSVIDSLNACASQYVLVRYAEGLVRMGKTHEEIVQRLEYNKNRGHVIALLDTLEYAYKGGRLSRATKVAGSLLHVKPIITADETGKVKILGKARGHKKAFSLFTELVEKTGGIDFSKPVCMAYSGLSDANMLEFMAQEASLFEGKEDKVYKMQFGATVGTYSGPGAFAIGYFHKKPDPDLLSTPQI